MGLLTGLLSSLLSTLGLAGSSSTSVSPSLQTVSAVAAEMNNAVSASINEASALTSSGLGIAAGMTTSTVAILNSTLTSGILTVANESNGMLLGIMPFDPQALTNTLSSDGQMAGSTLASYATQMPKDVAQGIAQGVQSFHTTFLPAGLAGSGYLFF
jgi:hypothetical protein